jgi:hypothetical protein
MAIHIGRLCKSLMRPFIATFVSDSTLLRMFSVFINQCVYSSGDVYPSFVKLSKGEYTLQLYIR